MEEIIKSATLLLVLLNPFLVILYLLDLVEKFSRMQFMQVLFRAGLISASVFCVFAILGDAFFSDFIQAEFASFQIFGGVVFLLIGLQFVFKGPTAIEFLRGESQHIAGSIAMPILIGPGTLSASIVIGQKHSATLSCTIIIGVVFFSLFIMTALKALHDYVRPRNEPLIQRYIEIAGRIMSLFVGTIAIEMIMRGLSTWIGKLQ
jgi:multiple antibiotic resistance protein